MKWDHRMPFEALKGKTLVEVKVKEDYEILFTTTEGEKYLMGHEQQCCEDVHIESIVGDLEDLVGSEILMAEGVEGESRFKEEDEDEIRYYSTWTFYKLATLKGYVDIRWIGESNGCYSESVDFVLLEGE